MVSDKRYHQKIGKALHHGDEGLFKRFFTSKLNDSYNLRFNFDQKKTTVKA